MSDPTYKDLCISLLLRLGEDKNITAEGGIIKTATVSAYLKAIPTLLGEALAHLATAGKYRIKCLDLVHEESPDPYVRYDLRQLAPDFYSLSGRRVFCDDKIATGYRLEGGRYFTLRGDRPGDYKIYYNAYPEGLPDPIPDTCYLSVDPEVYAILPLYIEGKLRLAAEEDNAAFLLSEFEQRRAELLARGNNLCVGARVTVAEGRGGALPW